MKQGLLETREGLTQCLQGHREEGVALVHIMTQFLLFMIPGSIHYIVSNVYTWPLSAFIPLDLKTVQTSLHPYTITTITTSSATWVQDTQCTEPRSAHMKQLYLVFSEFQFTD
jgi:hypothetical protein